MATYSKHILSGSTNGAPIAISAAAATGTIIHTAITGTGDLDEIYVWVTNNDSAAKKIIFEVAGTSTDHVFSQSIAAQDGLYLAVPGLLLNNAVILRARATATDTGLKAVGFVNRVVA